MEIEHNALKTFSEFWNHSTEQEILGKGKDYSFLRDSDWVQDSAVIDRIGYDKGKWLISLVFANPNASSNFIIRFIRSTISFKKAQVEAQFLRRSAAKDPRGTTTMSLEMFNCSEN